ncbi:MAG: CpsD/CapB family tyrosine-protein kinase [Clostridia bacterium]|nr:CpsD/CapB family tyrosine-protein kinase [Clostridia bacterium]
MKQCIIGNLSPLDYTGEESLNTICANLLFAGRDKKVFIVTSCTASEGKSHTVMHIARNLAERGRRICIVDADLRRSMNVSTYRIRTEDGSPWTGLAHYLAGYNEMPEVVYQTNIPRLYFIPIGRELVNPIRLLDTEDFNDLLRRLAKEFDMVLIDAPPVGVVVDAAVIASRCDGCIFVIEYNKTHRREINAAQRQIENSGCPMLGCILNKVDVNSLSSKHYYNRSYRSHYYSNYYKKDKDKRK